MSLKTTNNPRLASLLDELQKRFPNATVGIDAPEADKGGFLDVTMGNQQFAIECFKAGGFGLSSVPAEGYGEGADELLKDAGSLIERLAELVKSERRTEAMPSGLLRDLRLQRGVAQLKVAEQLGVKQPTVSRLEHQQNVGLNTLRRYVHALGGELVVSAKFGDELVPLEMPKKTRLPTPPRQRKARSSGTR